MSGKKIKTIIVHNHLAGEGHHESWTGLFTSILVKSGYQVICVTPNVDSMREILKSLDVNDRDNLQILPMPKVIPPKLKHRVEIGWVKIKRAFKTKQIEWKNKLLNLINSKSSFDFGLNLKKRSFPFVGGLNPVNLNQAIELAEKQGKWKPDFLFSMYVDIWIRRENHWQKEEPISLPWGGIRFAPFLKTDKASEGYFKDNNLKGLCFLDPDSVLNCQDKNPNLTFELLPDITNSELPKQPTELAKKIKSLANGRKVIILCGYLYSRKNIKMFCQLAATNPKGIFFVLAGQLNTESLSLDEKFLLKDFISRQNENTLFVDSYFEDEKELNSVIDASDYIFAAYRDFNLSSNMLAKSAFFQRPIMVSDSYLMGQIVTEHGIGVTIKQDDIASAVQGLDYLSKNQVSNEVFDKYRNLVSQDLLKNKMESFFNCL